MVQSELLEQHRPHAPRGQHPRRRRAQQPGSHDRDVYLLHAATIAGRPAPSVR